MTRPRTVSAFAIAIAIAACSKDMLPNTPSQLADGVVIYTHANSKHGMDKTRGS